MGGFVVCQNAKWKGPWCYWLLRGRLLFASSNHVAVDFHLYTLCRTESRSYFAGVAMQPYLNAFKTSLLRNGSFCTPLMTPAAKLLPIPSFLLPRLYASKVPRATDSKTDTESATQRQKIVLNDDDLIETFVRGSGPGGQCINKRSNCVDLRHIPTGLRVQVSCESSID